MNTVEFKGKKVSVKDIQIAIIKYKMLNPDTNHYKSWLKKDSYKFVLNFEGGLYPPKHILSRATGVDTSEFSGGEQTNKVYRRLSFVIIDKPK